MQLLPENELKLKRFVERYENKSVWQIDIVLQNFIKELIRDELNRKIVDMSNAIYSFQQK